MLELPVKDEKLIRLADVPRLPWMPAGMTIAAVHNWCRRGVRGIRLEVVSVGGVKCTTESALIRFMEQLSLGPAAMNTTAPVEAMSTGGAMR